MFAKSIEKNQDSKLLPISVQKVAPHTKGAITKAYFRVNKDLACQTLLTSLSIQSGLELADHEQALYNYYQVSLTARNRIRFHLYEEQLYLLSYLLSRHGGYIENRS